MQVKAYIIESGKVGRGSVRLEWAVRHFDSQVGIYF
jgi:hypothetical protein